VKLTWILWLSSLLPAPASDPLCLATTIYLEARDQPVEGQLAVAEVALRRLESGRHGSDLCTVVTQPKQFALTLVSPAKEIREWEAFHRAWGLALNSIDNWQLPPQQRRLVVPDADHFLAWERVSTDWAQGRPLHVIGDHGFYRVD
jgi:hypothetical protein